jgi:hypothetical protein
MTPAFTRSTRSGIPDGGGASVWVSRTWGPAISRRSSA